MHFLSILLVEVPVSLAIMVWIVRSEGGSITMHSLFPYVRKLSTGRLLGVGIPIALLSVALMVGLQAVVSEPLRLAWFTWVPDWAVYALTPEQLVELGGTAKLVLVALMLVSGVVVGAATQELYSRGFLLPRIAHIGPWSTVVSAVSFAVMHLISPWSWPVFALPAFIWAVLAYRERSTWLPVVCHVGMIAIMWIGAVFTLAVGS